MKSPVSLQLTPAAVLVGAGVVVGGVLLWKASKAPQEFGSAVVGGVADVGAGAVLGVGDVFGVPRTDADQCSIDLANGDLWAASFSCPAKRFLSEGVLGIQSAPAVASSDPATWGSETRVPAWSGGASGSW